MLVYRWKWTFARYVIRIIVDEAVVSSLLLQMSARDVMFEVNEYHRSSVPIVPLPDDHRDHSNNNNTIHRHRRQAPNCDGQ